MSKLQASTAAALARSPFFRTLSERARLDLSARGLETPLPTGEQLFRKGDAGDAVYVVLEGEIEIGVTAADGRQVRFAALGPGAVLGELAAIDGGPRSADATALRKSKLMRLNRDTVLDALQSEPPALLALAVELADRLRKADIAIETAVLSDLGAKLARHLLEESGAGAKLVQLTQVEMARRIGVSREKLNRKLAGWREEGVVEMTRAGLKISDLKALKKLAQGGGSD